MDWKKESKRLNSKAIQNPDTANPSTRLSASIIIKALITNKNRPNVIIVIGNVKMINIGFTINLSKASTTATIIAAEGDVTNTPGKK